MAYLLDHRNPHGDPFYENRREPILAIVEHITAGLEDTGFVGADHSAERTARYAATTDRRVSWHQGTDTDGTLIVLPDGYTAFHVRGYNSCTLGREISKTHTDWRKMSSRWVEATLGNAAPYDARWCRLHGIPVRQASKADLDFARHRYRKTGVAAPVGFVSHARLDPTRRTDPGYVRSVDTFPWDSYLRLVRFHLNPDESEDDVPKLLAMMKIEYAYRAFSRDPHTKAEAEGLRYWIDRVNASDAPEAVVEECEALLWRDAAKG